MSSSLCLLTSLVREGALSPVEVVLAHLRQIERLEPAIHAFVEQYPDQALEQARRSESCLHRGEAAGLLQGVPVTVKDSFDLAGRPTLCGSRFRIGHKAAHDATSVARLRAAGAIVIGKTNCPEFLANYETDNHLTGRTNNPWGPSLTPGGSSGGESAAIAALCSPGGLGSDGGGSVRVPAHCCGIAALKPTPGRISAAGHFPQIGHPAGLLGVAGPMARTAQDLTLLFSVLTGYDSQDPFAAPVPLRAPALTGSLIGCVENFNGVPVQDDVSQAVRRAAGLCAALGLPVDSFEPAGVERAFPAWWFFFSRVNAPALRAQIDERPGLAHWTGLELLERAELEPAPEASDILHHLALRDRMRASVLRQMERFPILLLPACGVAAWNHRQRHFETPGGTISLFDAMAPVTWVNLLGLPAVVIPMTQTAAGLPVGIQLVGRPYEEECILELAERLEEARGPFPSPRLALA